MENIITKVCFMFMAALAGNALIIAALAFVFQWAANRTLHLFRSALVLGYFDSVTILALVAILALTARGFKVNAKFGG
jgi:hypothetical protein